MRSWNAVNLIFELLQNIASNYTRIFALPLRTHAFELTFLIVEEITGTTIQNLSIMTWNRYNFWYGTNIINERNDLSHTSWRRAHRPSVTLKKSSFWIPLRNSFINLNIYSRLKMYFFVRKTLNLIGAIKETR